MSNWRAERLWKERKRQLFLPSSAHHLLMCCTVGRGSIDYDTQRARGRESAFTKWNMNYMLPPSIYTYCLALRHGSYLIFFFFFFYSPGSDGVIQGGYWTSLCSLRSRKCRASSSSPSPSSSIYIIYIIVIDIPARITAWENGSHLSQTLLKHGVL